MLNAAWIQKTRLGGYVRRNHTVLHVNATDYVARHSHGVACLVHAMLNGECTKNLLLAALLHDLSEHVTGDVPAPVKWDNDALRRELNRISIAFEDENLMRPRLSDFEKSVLKWADCLEYLLFCYEELEAGNGHMRIPYINIYSHLYAMAQRDAQHPGVKLFNDLVVHYGMMKL